MNKGYCPYSGKRMRSICKLDPCMNCPLDRSVIELRGKRLIHIRHPED